MATQEWTDAAQVLLAVRDRVPAVWRRLLVSPFTKLAGLHRIIQAVMGWDGREAHRFVLNGDIYRRIAPGEALDAARERNWRMDSAGYPDHWFTYVYGNLGQHVVRVAIESYVDAPASWRYPRCIDGAGEIEPRRVFRVGAANRRLWKASPQRYP